MGLLYPLPLPYVLYVLSPRFPRQVHAHYIYVNILYMIAY
jgi:hypothetical protein